MARTGRPREQQSAKNAPLNMRTSPDLRAQIERAADLNGRSLTQEVERRLITSFIFDDSRGGPHIGAFANMLCSMIQNIELETGHRWMDDFDTFTQVRGATERLLAWRNPGAPPAYTTEMDQAKSDLEAAQANVDAVDARREAFIARTDLPSKASGLLEVPIYDPSGLSEADRAEWDEINAELHTARIMLHRASTVASVASTNLWEAIDRVEQKGVTIADVVFEQLGPRK